MGGGPGDPGFRGDAATLTGGGPGGALPAAAPLLSTDPRGVGPYVIEGRLGAGGMGTVYFARVTDGRPVALKVIRAEYAADPRFRDRFASEVAAARRVARFCTAEVIDSGVDGGVVYLVTEFIDGPTLAAEVARLGPMTGSTLDGLAIGVAAALHGIHGAGVVHRDLKPGNVLLSRVGPKVIDFGVARALDGLAGGTVPGTDPTSGYLWGTPAYMAPEQFRGGPSAPASDVFAWGAVVAFAGTGRAPFGSGTPFQLMQRVVAEPPDVAGLDERLRPLVLRAMDKEPERRPSAYQLLIDLVGGVGDPVAATTAMLRTTWPAAPEPVAPVAAARQPQAAGPPTTQAPPAAQALAPRRRRGRVLLAALAAVLVVAAVGTAVALSGPDGGGNGPGPDHGPGSSPAAVGPSGTVATQDVQAGVRVPPTGYITLSAGQIRAYRFTARAGARLYLEGDTGACADVIGWQLLAPGGRGVFLPSFSCGQYGPFPLAAAGTYVLRIGGGTADGSFAFELTLR